MIIGEVKRYLRDNNSIRVSRSVRDLAYKAMQFKEKYIREKGKEPTIDIIAKELGVEREEIAYSFDAIQDPVSLQEPVYNDGAESIYIMDQVPTLLRTKAHLRFLNVPEYLAVHISLPKVLSQVFS